MIKKKKIALFRELYNEIEALLDSYFYKDVAVILREKHGLDVTAGTLKNYVFQHRQYLSNMEVDSEQVRDNQNNNVDQSHINSDKSLEIENDNTVLENEENSDTANTAPSEKISLAGVYASLGQEK